MQGGEYRSIGGPSKPPSKPPSKLEKTERTTQSQENELKETLEHKRNWYAKVLQPLPETESGQELASSPEGRTTIIKNWDRNLLMKPILDEQLESIEDLLVSLPPDSPANGDTQTQKIGDTINDFKTLLSQRDWYLTETDMWERFIKEIAPKSHIKYLQLFSLDPLTNTSLVRDATEAFADSSHVLEHLRDNETTVIPLDKIAEAIPIDDAKADLDIELSKSREQVKAIRGFIASLESKRSRYINNIIEKSSPDTKKLADDKTEFLNTKKEFLLRKCRFHRDQTLSQLILTGNK